MYSKQGIEFILLHREHIGNIRPSRLLLESKEYPVPATRRSASNFKRDCMRRVTTEHIPLEGGRAQVMQLVPSVQDASCRRMVRTCKTYTQTLAIDRAQTHD